MLQVTGLAVIAIVVATIFGSPGFGLMSAAAIVVGELLLGIGRFVLGSRGRQRSKT